MAHFNNSTSSDWTALPLTSLTPELSTVLIAKITIAVLSFSLNALVLALYLIKPSYITNFTVYLMFLYISNTVYLAGARPLEFLIAVRGVDVASFGPSACHFHIYVQRIVSVIPGMAHVLIAVNRLWALSHPISYRNRHTIKMATLICLGMACYAHIFSLPAFFLNWHTRNGRDALGNMKCEGRPTVSMVQWARADICVHRFLPLFIILGSYGYIFVKRWSKKRNRVSADNYKSGNRNRTPSSRSVPLEGHVQQSLSIATEKSKTTDQVDRTAAVDKKVVKPFLILTMTAVDVLVCWLPVDVIYFCKLFLGISVGFGFLEVFGVLYSVQFLFDPLMWPFSLRKSRHTRQNAHY